MSHETTIELDHQIVRQPFGAIDGLKLLHRRPFRARCGSLGPREPVAPILERPATARRLEENAIRSRPTSDEAPQPGRAPVTAVASENFVRAFAAEDDLELQLLGERAELEGRQGGGVSRRVVQCGGDARRGAPEVVLRQFDDVVLRPGRFGDAPRRRAFVCGAALGKRRRQCDDRLGGDPRHQSEQDGRSIPPDRNNP